MSTIEAYYHNGILYTWHHEPQNEYSQRHINIQSAVAAIENCKEPIVQDEYKPARYKHIGLSPVGIITVITDDTGSQIITAWHSSSEEVRLWLSWN